MDIERLLAHLEVAIEETEKANSGLEPELINEPDSKTCTELYAKLNRLSAFGVTAFAHKHDAADLARVTGTSMGKAKDMAATSEVLGSSGPLDAALRRGEVSLDQATEIAKAEVSAPGSAKELLKVAKKESFHVLKDEARRTKLEAEQHRGLAERQREAKTASHRTGELGMAQIHLAFQPHIGTPIMAKAEAEAERLARAARKAGVKEDFDKHLADAYANLLLGSGKGRAKRPELVVLVSHEVATRGWTDVKKGEMCKIPGVGPVAPEIAKEIGRDAFLNGVFFDGKDLRHFKRWGRSTPVEISVALELGKAPDFKGVRCVDCGNRFRPQFDHIEPVAAQGPTAHFNFDPRCDPCHKAKTARDRRAGKLKPKGPPKQRPKAKRTRRTEKSKAQAP
ncbi:MAG: hypothetical protein GEU71_13305 [Actinobacteria bacterium]|nr:hypothetical protein [Actinomycetota bacterium]